MVSAERFTTTYSSTPRQLTRAYLIPPIEDDPHFRDRTAQRARRELATLRATPANVASTAGAPNSAERAQRAAARVEQVEARRQAQYAAVAARQARAGQAVAPQLQNVQYQAAQNYGNGGPRPTQPKKRKSVLARVIPIVIFLVILGTVFRPALASLFEVFAPDPVPTEADPDAYQAPPDVAELATTDDLADALYYDSEGEHIGDIVTAYAVVIGESYISSDDTTYSVRLLGFQPSTAEDGPYETEATMIAKDDQPAMAEGEIILGRFVIEDPTEHDYSTTVTTLAWEETQPYDLSQDFTFEEESRDDYGILTLNATVTNSADIALEYTGDVIVQSEAGDGYNYVWTDEIPAGGSVTAQVQVSIWDLGDEPIETSVENMERY